MRRGVCVLFLLFAAAVSSATSGDALTEKARMLLDYQSFMHGDRDGAVRFMLTASRDLQGTPLAELAVRLALFYDPATLSAVDVGEAEARRALGNETELNAGLRDVLRRFVARSLASAGRREEAMQIHRRRGLAMSWLVSGPFTSRKSASFTSRDLPEPGGLFQEDVLTDLPGAARFRDWGKNPPWRPIPENRSFPFIRPWRLAGRQAEGAMYLFTALQMGETDNNADLHVYAETSWRLYIDGSLVAEVDKNSLEAPVEHMVSFPLDAGVHRVALQIFPPRVDKPVKDVRVALRLETKASFFWNRDLASPNGSEGPSARRGARRLKFLDDLQASMEESPLVTCAYAIGCLEQRMFDEAAWWAETAAGAEARDVNLLFFAGATTALNPLLPAERRRDTAVAWHKRALAVKPEVIPSLLYLAQAASDRGEAREAAEYLQRAYTINPSSLDVLLARGEWASRFASATTIRAAWEECAKAYPTSSAVQIAIASMPQEGFMDMERRLAACRAAVAAGPYVPEASLKLAEALADSGNQQEAEYVLRDALELFAGEVDVLVRIGEVYARLALYREAITVLSTAVRISPDNAAIWRRMGDLYMESGDQESAVRMWRVSLAAVPGQFQLADMLAHLEGRAEQFFSPGKYDAIAMTAEVDPNQYPGDVVRLLDRAVVRIMPDGSFRRLTHEIDLAKTREGGESLTSIETGGELLSARIVFPNGNTLEPEPFPGRGGLRLPIIMPGASREVRFMESVSATSMGPPGIIPWFFQDPNGRQSFLASEFVVRAPRNFPLVYVVRNFGNVLEFEKTVDGDLDIYRWTARLSLPSREPDAVHVSERVPSVEIGVKTSWDDIVFNEIRKLEGRLIPSMRMRRLLTTLYSVPSGQRPDPEQMARNIYRYVCDNIDPTPAEDMAAHIHVDRMGSRWLLLLSLLRAAGLDADPAAARPSQKFLHPPTWDLPSREIFTVPMVRLAIPGGPVYWLDVRFNSLPFGKIADDLSGATLLAFMPAGPLFEPLPSLPAEDSLHYEERLIGLPEAGGVLQVSGRSNRRGATGLAWGAALAEASAEERKRMTLRSIFSVFPDAELQWLEMLRADDETAAAQERYEITSGFPVEMRSAGRHAVSLCMSPISVISEEARTMRTRRTACHIRAEHIAQDRNVFSLPEGGAFLTLPEPAQIPSRFGLYQLQVVRQDGNRVEIIRNYHVPAQRIEPWEWENFLSFLERVDAAERQWLEYRCAEPAEDDTLALPDPQ